MPFSSKIKNNRHIYGAVTNIFNKNSMKHVSTDVYGPFCTNDYKY